jgi:hypothetical protein
MNMKKSDRERRLAEHLEHLMAGGGMHLRLSTGNSFLEAQEKTLSEDLIGLKEIYALCAACFRIGAEVNELARLGKESW